MNSLVVIAQLTILTQVVTGDEQIRKTLSFRAAFGAERSHSPTAMKKLPLIMRLLRSFLHLRDFSTVLAPAN